MRALSSRRFRSRAGFKLAELMVAVGIFVLGGGVAYPLLVGDVALYARNFSINKSDNSLRLSSSGSSRTSTWPSSRRRS